MNDDSAVNYLTPEQIRGKRIREGRPPVSDLRDRIAVVIANDVDVQYRGIDCHRLADAVIAALNLAKACQSGCVWQIPNRVEDMTPQQRELLGLRQETVGLVHRHVTEWVPKNYTACNPHPDAPHGFDRNASHNEGRPVCDCEHWSPPDDTLRDETSSESQKPFGFDLRDHIAAAIYSKVAGWDDFPFDQLTDNARAMFIEQADAVTDLLIDMAGHGKLLKAIDRMHRA